MKTAAMLCVFGIAWLVAGGVHGAPLTRCAGHLVRSAEWPYRVATVTGQSCRIPDAGAKATVLLFVAHDCPIANGYAPEIQRVAASFRPQGISFDLVYVEQDLSAAAARAHERQYGYSLPAVRDRRHALVNLTGATVTPEAVVLLRTGKVAYRGRIDNKYPALGQQRTIVTQHDLRAVLAAIVAGRPVPETAAPAVGCFIPPLD